MILTDLYRICPPLQVHETLNVLLKMFCVNITFDFYFFFIIIVKLSVQLLNAYSVISIMSYWFMLLISSADYSSVDQNGRFAMAVFWASNIWLLCARKCFLVCLKVIDVTQQQPMGQQQLATQQQLLQ